MRVQVPPSAPGFAALLEVGRICQGKKNFVADSTFGRRNRPFDRAFKSVSDIRH